MTEQIAFSNALRISCIENIKTVLKISKGKISKDENTLSLKILLFSSIQMLLYLNLVCDVAQLVKSRCGRS